MNFAIECAREVDGRWIKKVPQLPSVLCYGQIADEAMAKADILALRAMAERLSNTSRGPSKSIFPFQSSHESMAFC